MIRKGASEEAPFLLYSIPHLFMMHLITILGTTARNFYLESARIADLQSVIRGVTSERSLIISTQFRTDVFYKAKSENHLTILKLWAMYTTTDHPGIAEEDLTISSGEEKCLNQYFQGLNKLSVNLDEYGQYKTAFANAYNADPRNPLAAKVVGCDTHLVQHPSIFREPLMVLSGNESVKEEYDNFGMAMKIVNDKTHSN